MQFLQTYSCLLPFIQINNHRKPLKLTSTVVLSVHQIYTAAPKKIRLEISLGRSVFPAQPGNFLLLDLDLILNVVQQVVHRWSSSHYNMHHITLGAGASHCLQQHPKKLSCSTGFSFYLSSVQANKQEYKHAACFQQKDKFVLFVWFGAHFSCASLHYLTRRTPCECVKPQTTGSPEQYDLIELSWEI